MLLSQDAEYLVLFIHPLNYDNDAKITRFCQHSVLIFHQMRVFITLGTNAVRL